MTFPDFSRFFEVCRDVEPYPWQVRLANQVLVDRKWPDVLDLPTGSGKTSAVDIALYALAAAAHGGEFGVHPRRIIVVVDRRVLVDQAWRHGQQLLDRINSKAELDPVRRALGKLSLELPSSIRLRGACPTDPRWCRSADQVQIIASTVDQIGSRLLLRGYGVTPRMRSVEAGLVGQDTLLLLDEAHLAGPLLDTLDHLERCEPVRGIVPRRHVVQLSATTAVAAKNPFTLTDVDTNDATLRQRLAAPKTLHWTEKKPQELIAAIDAPCVLLVANTVRTALDWFAKTTKPRTGSKLATLDREPFLVTGRMRPVDRQEMLDAVEHRLEHRKPTLVVATQCVEVGVDWDFDAMVSECASWDALVQRMGRVNRRGQRDDAHCYVLSARRTIEDPESGEKVCPIYGRHETRTASWLARVSPVPCPPGTLPEVPEDCVRTPESAPLLIPEYLDLWSQNRAAGPAYDVSIFLHGRRQDRHAQVVWRDLCGLDLDDDLSSLREMLKALPPSSLEALPVPIREFRNWLGERRAIRIGTEITVDSDKDISPGSTVVVPTEYGGIGHHHTFDGSPGRVTDRSTTAMREHRHLDFKLYDAPPIDEAEPIEDQVQSWIEESDERSFLKNWTRVEVGRRWLFVSKLAINPDDDGLSFPRRPVTLESHLNGTSQRTQAVAQRLGLLPEMAEVTYDLVLAARLHDLGKLDARFQRLLGRKPNSAPLAQSGHSWIERRRRQAVSDYPQGERHEALSVELMIRHGLHATAHDTQLVEHLVASHHGWARPFIRAAQSVAEISDQVFGVEFGTELSHREAERAPARFRSVQGRFGWLGLAWLEAIVQLSDHRQVEDQTKGNLAAPGGAALDRHPLEVGRRIRRPDETILTTLNGLVPGDYLAALGVLRALSLANERTLLRWQGTQPSFATRFAVDGIVECLIEVRQSFRPSWPRELNKLTEDQCNELLLASEEPFRSLVVALISPGGRSEMDFVSGGRGGFKSVFEWATTNQTRTFSRDRLRRTLAGPRSLTKGGRSFRWNPLAAQGARRPKVASADRRTEPWMEWLAVMGISSLVSKPEMRGNRLGTRSTAVYGHRWDVKQFRWPLWRVPLAWRDVAWALAGTRSSLGDALWCETDRLAFGTNRNRTFGFAAGRPYWK